MAKFSHFGICSQKKFFTVPFLSNSGLYWVFKLKLYKYLQCTFVYFLCKYAMYFFLVAVSNDSIRSILLASLDESEDEIPNDDDGEGFLNTSPAGRGSLLQENTGLLSRLIDYSDDSDLDPDYLPGVSAPSSSDEEQASTSTGIKVRRTILFKMVKILHEKELLIDN